jgi:RNA repair pathway DNA polymerase beta family
MLLTDLTKRNLIHPPKWLPFNTVLMVTMGSQAYGVSTDASDLDVYGVCIPPKDLVFPHLAGEILGFGRQIQRFEVWQEHKVMSGALGEFLEEKKIPKTVTIEDVEKELLRRSNCLK